MERPPATPFRTVSRGGLVRIAGETLRRPGDQRIFGLLAEHLAVHYAGVLAPDDCQSLVRAVYEARPHWTPNFEGLQYTLGRAWYTHLEQDREEEYFARAAASDALVKRYLPGWQERFAFLVQILVGAPVTRRPGWCGAGVHVFPAGHWVSQNGGDVHYDNEGLSGEQIAERAPALTLVLMLQPPERGGELQVWDKRFEGDDEVTDADRARPSERVPYGEGDLVVIDSYRLHQIQPFSGGRDRISATVHAARNGERWEIWF